MEQNNNASYLPTLFNLKVNDVSKPSFKAMARFAILSAILSFIALAIQFVKTIFELYTLNKFNSSDIYPKSTAFSNEIIIGLIFKLIFFVILILMNIFLIRFGTMLKKSIATSHRELFISALLELKKYFRMIGVIIIILIILTLLAFILLFIAFGLR